MLVKNYRICDPSEFVKIFPYLKIRPAVVLMFGDMGSGKTTLVREFMRWLGFKGRVKSPTFTYEIVYEDMKISHVDLYRISQSTVDILDEILSRLEEGYLVFVEWPSRLGENIKDIFNNYPIIEIYIDIVDENCRDLKLVVNLNEH